MDKRVRIAAVTGLLLVTLAMCVGLNATTAKGPIGLQPRLTVELSRRTVEQANDESSDTWLYVTNPSRDMETTLPDWPREIVHVVEVNYLDVEATLPDGTLDYSHITPDVYAYRWDTTVYPGETSLVFFVGWAFPVEDGAETGVYTFTYTLNVDFDGDNFDLVRSFRLIVQ